MRVEQLGEGEPELAIVGGVHGDEPSGVRAVERLMDERPEVGRPVKLVVANEEAVERGLRYVEADLNRSFPGAPDGPTHESRLAAELAAELDGTAVLALHSTRSHPEPFAFVSGVDEFVREVVPRLPVVAAVEAGEFVEGRLFASAGVIEVEVGLQGSERAEANAHRVVEAFLAATGALDEPDDDPASETDDDPASEVQPGDEPPRADYQDNEPAGEGEPEPVPLFRLRRVLPKPDAGSYEVLVENFQRVEAGEAYATADGRPARAEEPFHPVLLSADGYEEIFGYAADCVGTLP